MDDIKYLSTAVPGTTGLRHPSSGSSAHRTGRAAYLDPQELRKDPKATRRGHRMRRTLLSSACPMRRQGRRPLWSTDSGPLLIDTSTAHRTAPGLGLRLSGAEAPPGQKHSRTAKRSRQCRAATPAASSPWRSRWSTAGIFPAELQLACFSLTGYSGGGKKMIAEYEDPASSPRLLHAPRQYALAQAAQASAGDGAVTAVWRTPPVFCPIVGDFYSGMQVTVPLLQTAILQAVTFRDRADAASTGNITPPGPGPL